MTLPSYPYTHASLVLRREELEREIADGLKALSVVVRERNEIDAVIRRREQSDAVLAREAVVR